MDKQTFIEVAPKYYAAALVYYLSKNGRSVTIEKLVDEYSYLDDDTGRINRIRDGRLLHIAILKLMHDGIVVVEDDVFGPPIISKSPDFPSKMFDSDWLGADITYKAERVGRDWLDMALMKLWNHETSLGINESDYDQPDSEWAPIPIDRDLPELQSVVSALDDAVEAIRTDNGYAATQPEERDFVLGGFNTLQKQFHDGETITIPFLRQYAIEPATKLLKRFGEAVVGVAVIAFRDRLKDWLMHLNIHWPF